MKIKDIFIKQKEKPVKTDSLEDRVKKLEETIDKLKKHRHDHETEKVIVEI